MPKSSVISLEQAIAVTTAEMSKEIRFEGFTQLRMGDSTVTTLYYSVVWGIKGYDLRHYRANVWVDNRLSAGLSFA